MTPRERILTAMWRGIPDPVPVIPDVNTFETMLNGTVQEVEREAKACIDAAASGGGFILSTGDQCGRDTPDENLFALIEVAKTYERYSPTR